MSRKHNAWTWMRAKLSKAELVATAMGFGFGRGLRSNSRGAAGGWSMGLHFLAIILGIGGAIMVAITVMLYYGYTTPSAVDGITKSAGELYSTLFILGAVGSEIGYREL